jgi:hypothetical protein
MPLPRRDIDWASIADSQRQRVYCAKTPEKRSAREVDDLKYLLHDGVASGSAAKKKGMSQPAKADGDIPFMANDITIRYACRAMFT